MMALTVALSLASLMLVGSATAQEKQEPKPIVKGNPHPTTEYDTTILTTMPPMPLLPEYSGKGAKLVNALTYPNLKHGKCYTVRMNLIEAQPVVHDWYLHALYGSGWKIKDDQLDQSTIVARHTKERASCTIVVQQSATPGFKTEVMIRYMDQSR